MKCGSELNSVKPGQLSEYRKQVKIILDRIAAWGPRPTHVVSETAMVIALTDQAENFKRNRDIVHACFEVLQDRGVVVRESGCWRFRRAFTHHDADELIAWDGIWSPATELSKRAGR